MTRHLQELNLRNLFIEMIFKTANDKLCTKTKLKINIIDFSISILFNDLKRATFSRKI